MLFLSTAIPAQGHYPGGIVYGPKAAFNRLGAASNEELNRGLEQVATRADLDEVREGEIRMLPVAARSD